MKKLHSMMMMFAIMVTALGFTACSDDDDDKGKVEASIVGEWELIDIYVDPIEAKEQGVVTANVGLIIEFASNMRYKEDGDDSGSWKIDGNHLYLTPDTFPVPYDITILQLNDTTLKIEVKYTGFLYNEQTNDVEETKITVQQTYKKIS